MSGLFFMKTLIITNSTDVTVDLLINSIGAKHFVRLNYDRPKDWKIELTDNSLLIHPLVENPPISDKGISKCIWRKPFSSEPEFSPFNDQFFKSEWKFLLYEIYKYLQTQGKSYLNPPIPDYLFTKHEQNRIAKKYFQTTRYTTYSNSRISSPDRTIAKSISGSPFSDGRIFYTVDVSNSELDDSIWTLQEKIERSHDLTVVFAYGKLFGFELDRKILRSIDWRTDAITNKDAWKQTTLAIKLADSINEFMRACKLNYGRLDFLADAGGENPVGGAGDHLGGVALVAAGLLVE